MSSPSTLSPLSCDPVQCRIGLAICDYLKSQFDIVELLMIRCDLKTSEFMIQNLNNYTFQSELAFQSEFPLINSYLEYIRNLFNLYFFHPDYWEDRIKAFHALVDSFKSLNEIAFSEVEYIDFSEVELPSAESETIIECEKAFNQAQEILNKWCKEDVDFSDFFQYVKSVSFTIRNSNDYDKTLIQFSDSSELLFDHDQCRIHYVSSVN